MDLRDFSKTGLELVASRVLDPAVLDEHGEVPIPILTLDPSEVVDIGREYVGSSWLEGLAEDSFNILLEDGEGHPIDSVFQPLPCESDIFHT